MSLDQKDHKSSLLKYKAKLAVGKTLMSLPYVIQNVFRMLTTY